MWKIVKKRKLYFVGICKKEKENDILWKIVINSAELYAAPCLVLSFSQLNKEISRKE